MELDFNNEPLPVEYNLLDPDRLVDEDHREWLHRVFGHYCQGGGTEFLDNRHEFVI
jgi:hypothetical protein